MFNWLMRLISRFIASYFLARIVSSAKVTRYSRSGISQVYKIYTLSYAILVLTSCISEYSSSCWILNSLSEYKKLAFLHVILRIFYIYELILSATRWILVRCLRRGLGKHVFLLMFVSYIGNTITWPIVEYFLFKYKSVIRN